MRDAISNINVHINLLADPIVCCVFLSWLAPIPLLSVIRNSHDTQHITSIKLEKRATRKHQNQVNMKSTESSVNTDKANLCRHKTV